MARKSSKTAAEPQALSETEAAAVVGGVSYFQGRVLTAADLNAEQGAGGKTSVEFAAGNLSSPVVLGSPWNGTDKPPS